MSLFALPSREREKPEPPEHLGPNRWSRRITGEHRLVYVVTDEEITVVNARGHY
ncbi:MULTISPECIES: Txe/YoeB family addiction module toxin [unclassified Nocardiopsis]|uniref:Txe/YoeB family addiction module toxin n=1 Tax=unclassified Nocardiopsis TaxID=2649073 RepID=UPI0023796AA4|nr:Txe/YoeB family addiction module toxin [Nocardiopsis sp. TSRI0078]